jgi:uncharacterized membrane-anchored protein YjiN (DUF445 family)
MVLILLGFLLIGCHPKIDLMSKAEKIFIKMVDKAAAKLNLNEEQKTQLGQLKMDIRKNFREGQVEKKEALKKIKEEGMKENPDIQKMTSSLQESLRDEAHRINQAFDLMLDYQKNLNEDQKKKLTQMISEWVKKWD